MAAKDDDLAPLDLSKRRKNEHNEGTNKNSPNKNSRPRPFLFPPATLKQETMGASRAGAPRSTSFESYSHIPQAHQATDGQYFPRGFQSAPGQFFSPENELNLYPQPKPKPPVPLTNDIWNRKINYSNNQNYNQTANTIGDTGPLCLGFRLPWTNPYENYSHQSNLNNYHLLPGSGAQMLMPQLFPFQPNPILNPFMSCHHNYGNGNSPYEHPHCHCSHRGRCEQSASSTTCHPSPTHNSSFHNCNCCCAQNHSAYPREETQGDNNGLERNVGPEQVIPLVSTGSIKIDTDEEDVTFLGHSSSIKIEKDAGNENENENENNRDEREHVVRTSHGPVGIPGPSINFDEYTDEEKPPLQLSTQVPIPGPSSIYPQPESPDIRSDTALKQKQDIFVASGIFSRGRRVSHPGSKWCLNPTETTEVAVKEPTDKIRVLHFGVSKKADDKTVSSNFEETVSEKCGRSVGQKLLQNTEKGDKASVEIPSPRAIRENKGPTLKS